jgi:hypothetical protein
MASCRLKRTVIRAAQRNLRKRIRDRSSLRREPQIGTRSGRLSHYGEALSVTFFIVIGEILGFPFVVLADVPLVETYFPLTFPPPEPSDRFCCV